MNAKRLLLIATLALSVSSFPVFALTETVPYKSIDLGGDIKLEMVLCPGVTPVFYMGKFEVTHTQWEAVMGTNPSEFMGEDYPVENISWNDCLEFLKKFNALPAVRESGLTVRLPTASEWEYACRAGAKGKYCKLGDGTEITDETLDQVAWFEDNSAQTVHPVGAKAPNAFGLHDMNGNVWEWTLTGDDASRIPCGGSWDNAAKFCESSGRFKLPPSSRRNTIGFRLCASKPVQTSRAERGGEDGRPAPVLKKQNKNTPKGWTDDFESALEVARQGDKPLFIFIDGSKSVQARCQKLLVDSQFAKEVGKHYVLLYLDLDQTHKGPKHKEQCSRVIRLLETDWHVPQVFIAVPDGEGEFDRVIRNGDKVAGKLSRFRMLLDQKSIHVEMCLDYLAQIAEGLSHIRDAEKKIALLGNRDSSEAMKIMRNALVKINEEALGSCFVEDAEAVVESDGTYLKDFPYLEFVKPLRDEFSALQEEIDSAVLEMRLGKHYDGKEEKKAAKRVFSRGNYKAKFQDLINRVNAAQTGFVGHRPQTVWSLDRLQYEIQKQLSDYTE